ncbi:4Fe-4S binding protein [Candidatus Woesearchaeota archaeon]|nr:4Fe-4S binding protein [Candidatus Woesearchaeota archaeon]
MTVGIDYKKCCWKDGKCTSCCCAAKCNGCLEACATGAIIRKDIITIDQDKCTECGLCVAACKYGAITII